MTAMTPKERRLEYQRAYRRNRYATDPDYRARSLDRSKRYNRKRYAEDPEFRAKVIAYTGEYNRKRYAEDPEFRARMNESARQSAKRAYDASLEHLDERLDTMLEDYFAYLRAEVPEQEAV